LLSRIGRRHNKELEEMFFSRPISKRFRELLKRSEMEKILTIHGEGFDSSRYENL